MKRNAKLCMALAGIAATVGGSGLSAQSSAVTQDRALPSGAPSLAITFDAAGANQTTSHSFWLKGASAEGNMKLTHGLGLMASFTILDTSNSGGGVPLKLGIGTFGPSYEAHTHLGSRPANLFAHGLVGSVKAFNGLFPGTNGYSSGANGLAAKAGGGLDLRMSPHLWVRVLEVNWLRTDLPNGGSNVQNDMVLSAGFVFRTGKR